MQIYIQNGVVYSITTQLSYLLIFFLAGWLWLDTHVVLLLEYAPHPHRCPQTRLHTMGDMFLCPITRKPLKSSLNQSDITKQSGASLYIFSPVYYYYQHVARLTFEPSTWELSFQSIFTTVLVYTLLSTHTIYIYVLTKKEKK